MLHYARVSYPKPHQLFNLAFINCLLLAQVIQTNKTGNKGITLLLNEDHPITM